MSVLVIGKCPSASACRVPVRAGLPVPVRLARRHWHRLCRAWARTGPAAIASAAEPGLGLGWAGTGLGTEERACAMRIK